MITINNFSKTYSGRKVVDVPGLSLSENRIYAVIGANGSGKSTWSKVLSGIEKADTGKNPFQDKLTVGYMSQQSYAFRMSLRRNILQNGSGKEEDLMLADELIQKLNLSHLAEKPAKKLSGGETARMALCRILMKKYDILILDEPMASMDMESALLSEELIREYQIKNRNTILLITHSIPQAARMADEILFFHQGSIMEYGIKNDMLSAPKSEELKRFLTFSGFINHESGLEQASINTIPF